MAERMVDTISDSSETVDVDADGSSVAVAVARGLKVSLGRY